MSIYKNLNKRTMEVVALDHRTVQLWYKTCVTIHSLIIMKDMLTTANPWGCTAVLWATRPASPSDEVLLAAAAGSQAKPRIESRILHLLNTT